MIHFTIYNGKHTQRIGCTLRGAHEAYKFLQALEYDGRQLFEIPDKKKHQPKDTQTPSPTDIRIRVPNADSTTEVLDYAKRFAKSFPFRPHGDKKMAFIYSTHQLDAFLGAIGKEGRDILDAYNTPETSICDFRLRSNYTTPIFETLSACENVSIKTQEPE